MSFLSDVFGSKPQIADYTPVDLSAEQIKAIEGDIAAWPQIADLGNLFQQYMLGQYETAIPGFRDILKMGGQTTQDMLTQADQELKGEIPADVQAQVERSSAYQNLLAGGGGGMASANTARNLGLTSLDLIGQGAQLAGQAGNAAQRWAALSGAQMPEGMLVSPQQQADLDMQQNLIKRNIQQQKFNVAAAPDPPLQALNQWVEQVGGSVVASYLGGGKGGMGGGGANYKTTYDPASAGTGDVSAAPSTAPGNAPAFAPVTASETGGATAGTAYNPYNLGFQYGVGYPSADPSQYYGGSTAFTDYLTANAFQQGAFGG